MGAESLTYIVELHDKFTEKFNKVNKSVSSFESIIKKAGAALSVAFIGQKVLGFMSDSIDAWNEQAQAIAQVETVLKTTGGTVGRTLGDLTAQATKLQSETIFGNDAILQGVTSNLLSFTNITGKAFDRTQAAILDVTTRLHGTGVGAETLKSVSLQLGKALNDPAQGLQALTRGGIQFSQQERDRIETLQKSGKLQEAQAVILGVVERKFGGSAKAAAAAGKGGIMQLHNAFNDMQKGIGKELMPVLSKAAITFKRIIEESPARSLEIQKTTFNRLAGEIKNTNLTTEQRNVLIQKAQEIAPDFLKGITDEATIMKEIDKQTAEANKSLTERIKLMQLQMRASIIQQDIATKLSDIERYKLKADELRTKTSTEGIGMTGEWWANLGTDILNWTNKIGALKALAYAAAPSTGYATAWVDIDATMASLNERVAKMNEKNLPDQQKELDKINGIIEGMTEKMKKAGIITPEFNGNPKLPDSLSSITSAAPKVFNINIEQLIGEFQVQTQTLKEGSLEAKDIVLRGLMAALNDVQLRANL